MNEIIIRLVLAVLIALIGCVLIADLKVILGVFLFVWANNITLGGVKDEK